MLDVEKARCLRSGRRCRWPAQSLVARRLPLADPAGWLWRGRQDPSARRLAPIVGNGNYLKPNGPLVEIPRAFLYLGFWFLMVGTVYYFLRHRTPGQIDRGDREGPRGNGL